MSKLGKFALGLAAFLLLSGGLLAMLGWVMGGETSLDYHRSGYTLRVTPFGIRSISRSAENPRTPEVAVEVVEKVEALEGWGEPVVLDAFTKLDIDVSTAAVVLSQGEGYDLYLEWEGGANRLEYSLENGVLKVWDQEINIGWADRDNSTVVIQYPAQARLDQVDVRSDVGKVEIYDLEAAQLTVKADLGEVYLNGLTLDNLEVTANMGQITAQNLEVAGKTTATADMGSLSLDGVLHQMELSCSMGSLTVYTDLPRSEYSYELETGMGQLLLDGNAVGGGELSGGSGPYEIQANCDMGNLEIYFG